MMNDTFMKEKPVLPLILSMALPMVLSMLVNSLYNIIDSFFVAQISEEAMTALSLVYPVQNFINAVGIGFGVGINAVIAFYLGAGDNKKADQAATQGLVLAMIHGVVMTVCCITMMPAFLGMFTSSKTVIELGVRYSVIAFPFTLIIIVGVTFEKLFQAVGNMKTTMISLMCGCITNIVLDPVLIFGYGPFPEMGIEGAALATGIGQALTLAIYLVVYFVRPIRVHKICPYGYRKSADGRMEPNPETAAVVQLIFQLAATGIGAAAITRELFKRGVPTPGEYKAAHGQQYHDVSRSRGRWSSSTVLRILEDERYIGSYVIGRRAVIEVGGTRSRMKDRDKWFIIPDHHPAIIEKELFEKVQAVQRRFSLPTRKIREYPLKSKVYCGCCDHALSRIAQKKPFYMCRHSTADVNSRCHTIRADAAGLEEAVLITLKKQLEILLPAHEDGTLHLDATAAKCSEYEKQLEDLRDQKQALFERYLLGQIELDAYKSEKAVYDAEIRKVKNAYAAVTAQAKLKQEEQARQSNRQEIVHSIAEADGLTSELTDLLIEKVYVFPDNRIEIVYKVHDLFE